MPMGLRNAPVSWQRTANHILHSLRNKICLHYLDIILVFSKDFENHLERLEMVLKQLEEAGTKLKPKK